MSNAGEAAGAAAVERPESPGRRRFFTLVAGSATGVAVAALVGAVSRVLLAPLLRAAKGASPGIDVGAEETFEATRAGQAGPQEIVVSRTVEDGYMTRKVKERFAVVADATSPAGLVALSTTCTHLGCGVSWNAERKAFLCPCHGGVYDATGKVLSGPPPRPLRRLPLAVEGGRVRLDVSTLENA